MPGVLLPPFRQDLKRPAETDMNNVESAKRTRRVTHRIKHKQLLPIESLPAVQNEQVFQAQIERAIGLALTAQGYDDVKPSALEAFRAQVEEFMLNFLHIVHHSMTASRRDNVVPQDYTAALAKNNITPSDLLRFLKIRPEPTITQPTLGVTPAADFSVKDYQVVLGKSLDPLTDGIPRKYIPAFLPKLPSLHTWKTTKVEAAREQDAQKIRELATQEGVLAEQALRRLVAASSKASEGRNAVGKHAAVSGRALSAWEKALEKAQEIDKAQQAMEEAENMDADDMETDLSLPTRKAKAVQDTSFESGIAVNYDRRFWRASGRGKT